jgi:hypothetical protein
LRSYGKNDLSGRFRLRISANYSPLFYIFLLTIVVGQYVADEWYYGYDSSWL